MIFPLSKKIFLLSLFLQTNIAHSKSKNNQDNLWKKSIAEIYSTIGKCSGTLISKQIIITAGHCVQNLGPVKVVFKNEIKPINAKVLYLSHSIDLAFLKLESEQNRPIIRITSNNHSFKTKSKVTTVGHPWNQTYKTSKGEILSFNNKRILFDLDIAPGNSGGPVLDKDGKLISIIYALSYSTSSKFIATGIPIESLIMNCQN